MTQETSLKHDLSDARVVYQLCFEFLEHQIDIAERIARGTMKEDEAQRLVADTLQWTAWTLGGENPDFLPAPGWSGAPLGRHLRCVFAKNLITLSDKDQETFQDDASIIVFAMCRFSCEVQELLCSLQSHAMEMTQSDARACHDLCVRWTQILTNKPFQTPLQG